MGGLGHDFKAGVNFINEPRLFITFNTGKGVDALHAPRPTTSTARSQHGARSTTATRRRTSRSKQFATYVQDDWRVSDRLTLTSASATTLSPASQFDQSNEPELPWCCRRPAPPAASPASSARELRQDAAGRQEQLPAAHRRRLRRARQRQGRRPRRLGHLHRLRLHQLERAVRGRRAQGRASGRCSHADATPPASGIPTAASTRSGSR